MFFHNLLLVFALFSPIIDASPLVEEHGRFVMDWGRMRIQFYGINPASREARASAEWKDVEETAWQEGLYYFSGEIEGVHNSYYKDLTDEERGRGARIASRNVTSSTYSRNTTYFGDGAMKVDLENSLAKAMNGENLRFLYSTAPDTSSASHSGVVLKLQSARNPSPTYKLVDESGEVLLDVQQISEEGFRKNLMGRWFKGARDETFKAFVGENPVEIEVGVKNGHLIVTRSAWNDVFEQNLSLIRAGKIAILIP